MKSKFAAMKKNRDAINSKLKDKTNKLSQSRI